ncbi:MAG TPA: formyltransferase family protein [Ktedonobacterales bacterium]
MSLASSPAPCIVYFGTTSRLSAPPLRALLDAGMDVRAIVLPALDPSLRAAPAIAPLPMTRASVTFGAGSPRRLALPMAGTTAERNIVAVAAERGLPVFEVARLADPETLATLAVYSPDVICVACFPLRLPPALLELPRFGCLNLHPALLPENRGPDPLFWTFQRGQSETGVTIHRMDAGLDTGPILAQTRFTARDGVSEAELERDLARLGAEQLVRVVGQLFEGTAVATAQDESRATRFPWPTIGDYEIMPSWPARRAYRFARGILGRAQPPWLRLDDLAFAVREPLGYDAEAVLGVTWRHDGDMLELQCSPGVLRARVAQYRDE